MSSGSGSGGEPGLPEEEMAVRLEAIGDDLQVHSWKAHGGVGGVAPARPARSIDQHVGVMHEPWRARQDLDRSHVLRLVDWRGQDEVVKPIVAVRIEHEAGWRRQHEIGYPELPRGRERWRGRYSGVAFRRSSLHPGRQLPDRVIRQPPLADEVAMALDRRPGRHVTPAGHLHNLPGAPANLLVGRQRERSNTAVVMTWGAPRVDDRRDVGRKRGRCLGDGSRQSIAPAGRPRRWPAPRRTQLTPGPR